MADLPTRLGIPSLEDVMRHGRLKWFGHVKRMNKGLWQKQILYHKVDGKYKGQPKKRCIDNIKNDRRFLNINEDLTTDHVLTLSEIDEIL